MSLPEVLLWPMLSRRRAGGLLFARQRPLGPYVADYYCHEALFVIEIDGRQHEGRTDQDQKRDAWLRDNGYDVMRIAASEVLRDTGAVVEHLVETAQRRIETLTGKPFEAPPKRPTSGNKTIRPRRTRRA